MNINLAYMTFCDDNGLPRLYVSRRQRMKNWLLLAWSALKEWRREASPFIHERAPGWDISPELAAQINESWRTHRRLMPITKGNVTEFVDVDAWLAGSGGMK